MPASCSRCWKVISWRRVKGISASTRSPRTHTSRCSPSRSTVANHAGRHLACCSMCRTLPRFASSTSLTTSVVNSVMRLPSGVLTAESQSGVACAKDVGGHDRPELLGLPALLAVRYRRDRVPALEQLKVLTECADQLSTDMAGLGAGQPGHHG